MSRRQSIIAISIGIAISIALLYLLFIREQVIPAVEGKASPWFQAVVKTLYPRLATENRRFPAEFFLHKADQVIIRFSLLTLGIGVFSWLYSRKEALKNRINFYFEQYASIKQAKYLIAFIYIYLLYTSWDIYEEYKLLSGIRGFYTPIFPLKYFSSGFPSEITVIILFGVFLISCFLSAIRIKPLISSVAAILSFLYLYGIRMGFEKIDHGFTTIIYLLLLFPFFMYAYEKAKKNKSEVIDAWSLQFMKIIIPMCYFMAGIEKLLSSGVWWLKAENFKTLLYIHQQPMGLWVMKYDILCFIFPLAAWLFQFCFISILRWPRLTIYFLITGILFHEGTYFLLGAGDPFTPWIAVYAVYLIQVKSCSEEVKPALA